MSRTSLSIPLPYQIIVMFILGGFFGYFFPGATEYTDWIGVIFLRLLNMIIVPLILFTITTGVASVGNSGSLGRLGLKTLSYYIISTLIAIVTGFLLVTIIKIRCWGWTGFYGTGRRYFCCFREFWKNADKNCSDKYCGKIRRWRI